MSAIAPPARIFLLRHARSGWAQPGELDFDRTLDAQGIDEAGRIGLAMAVNGYLPSRILCSSARRCVQTLDVVKTHLAGSPDIVFTPALYANDHEAYITLIRDQVDIASVMVVGHNPMMEHTAHCLMTRGRNGEQDMLRRGFPTAGLAIFDIEGQLADAGRQHSRLAGFLTPGDV